MSLWNRLKKALKLTTSSWSANATEDTTTGKVDRVELFHFEAPELHEHNPVEYLEALQKNVVEVLSQHGYHLEGGGLELSSEGFVTFLASKDVTNILDPKPALYSETGEMIGLTASEAEIERICRKLEFR